MKLRVTITPDSVEMDLDESFPEIPITTRGSDEEPLEVKAGPILQIPAGPPPLQPIEQALVDMARMALTCIMERDKERHSS